MHAPNWVCTISNLELIHDQLPLAVPCYDLVPVTELTLGPTYVETSGIPGSLDLTGGEYKRRERIHRGLADPRLLAIPASWGRVAALNLNWRIVWRIGSGLPRRDPLSTRLYYVCSPGCQRDMLIWRHPLLPPSPLYTKFIFIFIK